MWVDKSNKEVNHRCIDKYSFSQFDFSRCELIRPEYFSTREKAHVTFDCRGLYFNKMCNSKLSRENEVVENVDIYYNPTERLVIIKKLAKRRQNLFTGSISRMMTSI